MTDAFNMTPDADLQAMVKRGERAQAILDERARQRRREEMARTPLEWSRLTRYSGAFQGRIDETGAAGLLYNGVPVAEMLAACPIPEGARCTPSDARATLRTWDEYVLNHHKAVA